MTNTIAILEQGGNSGTAAEYAYEYVNGGKSDWHLPSKDELNELWKVRVAVGGFALPKAYSAAGYYWSSSEFDSRRLSDRGASAYIQGFTSLGDQGNLLKTNISTRVRPVRAL